MSSLPAVRSVLDTVASLDRKAAYLSGQLASRSKAVASLEAELAESRAYQELLEKVKAVLSHLLENTAQKDLGVMDSLVTYGLRTVYPEKGLSFKSEVVDSGKKISVEMSTFRDGMKASKDQHGSVSVLESLIIRILAILKLQGARVLIADEPFSAVGQDHINNVGALLEELSRKLGMDILLVTHNPGVSDACMFRASLRAGNQLRLDKVGGAEGSGAVAEIPADVAPQEQAVPKASPKKRATTKKKAESP